METYPKEPSPSTPVRSGEGGLQAPFSQHYSSQVPENVGEWGPVFQCPPEGLLGKGFPKQSRGALPCWAKGGDLLAEKSVGSLVKGTGSTSGGKELNWCVATAPEKQVTDHRGFTSGGKELDWCVLATPEKQVSDHRKSTSGEKELNWCVTSTPEKQVSNHRESASFRSS